MAKSNNFKIIEESKTKLIFEMDSNHGFANLLVETLWTIDGVKAAAYHKLHPELPTTRFVVEANNPKEAIKEAIKKIKQTNKKFLDSMRKLKLE